MIVKCVRECWSSKLARRYVPNDQDDIDSMDHVAMYFEGWPPGTKVYHKERGTKTTPVKKTFRIIPGKIEAAEEPEKEWDYLTADLQSKYTQDKIDILEIAARGKGWAADEFKSTRALHEALKAGPGVVV